MKPLALVLAAVFVVIAILYWTGHFYPSGVHTKHGIVSIGLPHRDLTRSDVDGVFSRA